MRPIRLFLLLAFGCVACATNKTNEQAQKAVVTGLDGRKFYAPSRPEKDQIRLDSNFSVAEKNFARDPSEENYIWLGRREAYRYNYEESIEIFTRGIQHYPVSYKLYRHRGHRYITVRDFSNAILDLQRAVDLMPPDTLETESDGQPNKLNIPLSTVQFNIWYHLGLAHYLHSDFANAERAYLQCLAVSNNDDLLCATADWLYMIYRRQGKSKEADELLKQINEKMNIIENDSYHKRLMMYKGVLKPEQLLSVDQGNEDPDLAVATQGYGVGNWYLYNRNEIKAKEIFQQVVAGNHFAAFGFIAAEVELAGMQ